MLNYIVLGIFVAVCHQMMLSQASTTSSPTLNATDVSVFNGTDASGLNTTDAISSNSSSADASSSKGGAADASSSKGGAASASSSKGGAADPSTSASTNGTDSTKSEPGAASLVDPDGGASGGSPSLPGLSARITTNIANPVSLNTALNLKCESSGGTKPYASYAWSVASVVKMTTGASESCALSSEESRSVKVTCTVTDGVGNTAQSPAYDAVFSGASTLPLMLGVTVGLPLLVALAPLRILTMF